MTDSTAPPTTALVEDYLARQRDLGFALRIDGRQLLNFARFVDGVGHHGPLTVDLMVQWATQPSLRPRQFPARRLDVVRPFARHLAALDLTTEVPPRGILGPRRRRPLHHIYTNEEIAALIAAARQITPHNGLRPATYATLFGLLAASGLRISEALRLTRGDVDLLAGVLTVRMTKFRKSRLVPLHSSTTSAMRAYAAQRDVAVPQPPSPVFFTTSLGTPLPYSTVRGVFRRLCATLGWESRIPRPRIHDLRHTFACQRLQQWYAEGIDVTPHLAALATYLGHAKITDTYWYLTATPDLLALAAGRFASFTANTGGM